MPPAWIARILERAVDMLGRTRRALMPANVAATELGVMSWAAVAVAALVELRVPDVLSSAPHGRTSDDVAAELGLHAPSLRRLLRAMTAFGVVREDRSGRFTLTRIGRALRSDLPESAAGMVRYANAPWHLAAYAHLAETIRTGIPGFTAATQQRDVAASSAGIGLFDFIAAHPEAAAIFDCGMQSIATLHTDAVLNAYDFSAHQHVVDVGGGNGTFAHALLRRYPNVSVTVYDATSCHPERSERSERSRRTDATVHFESGNFFHAVPSGADCYILAHVLHDWEEASARAILQSVRSAMSPNARVLIVEIVLPSRPDNRFSQAKMSDLEMLAMLPGKERTRAEYSALLASANLRLARILPTAAAESILVCRPS